MINMPYVCCLLYTSNAGQSCHGGLISIPSKVHHPRTTTYSYTCLLVVVLVCNLEKSSYRNNALQLGTQHVRKQKDTLAFMQGG